MSRLKMRLRLAKTVDKTNMRARLNRPKIDRLKPVRPMLYPSRFVEYQKLMHFCPDTPLPLADFCMGTGGCVRPTALYKGFRFFHLNFLNP